MKFRKKRGLWTGLFAAALLSFTVFVVLDTFVIARVYQITDSDTSSGTGTTQGTVSSSDTAGNANSLTDSSSGSTVSSGDAVVTDSSYSDGNITVTITEYREDDTTIYVADVTLSSAEYLQTAFANNAYGKNVTATTSTIAAANSAILAINGDYYGAQNSGYVIRGSVIYRNTVSNSDQEDLVIYQDGSMEIVTEGSVTAEELAANGAEQVLSFGPGLVEDGEISVSQSTEVDKAMANNPRTAIGIISDLHYVLVVSDGRTSESTGLTLYQLAEFMQGTLGVETAYNLDGGGSSTMYFNGEVINNPTTDGNVIKERSVSDIVYIGY